MRLHQLSSDQPSFRTVQFNTSGPTLIVARRQDTGRAGRSRTYNGVGKSLLVYLLHFCLGSDRRRGLEEALPDWTFFLEFSLSDQRYVVSRNTLKQSKITLNEEKITLKELRGFLGSECFFLDDAQKYMSFRSLLPAFLRPGKQAYVSPEVFYKEETPFLRLLRASYLLGLDQSFVIRKKELAEEKDRLSRLQQSFSSDPVIRAHLGDATDLGIELSEVEDHLHELESSIEAYRVAENYAAIQREADEIEAGIRQLRNEIHLLNRSISHIDKAVQQKPDVSADAVLQVYEEAKRAMPEAVVRSLRQVTEFHTRLMEQRALRLAEERRQLQLRRDELRSALAEANEKFNSLLRYLETHGALEEYHALTQRVSELRALRQRLLEYQQLSDRYETEVHQLGIRLSEENLETANYLHNVRPHLEKVLSRFRTYVRGLYPAKNGGIVVSNNEGENQIRFNIEAKIHADSSDGINEAKIFCFDMTVLESQLNHKMKFVFHDSRLFSDIDPRQRAQILRAAAAQSRAHNFQYIATLNEDQISGMRGEFSPEEQEVLFGTETITLELTDESPEGKLLGRDVALDYE